MLRANNSFFDIYSKIYISLVVDAASYNNDETQYIFSPSYYYGLAAAAAIPGTILPKIEWPLATW